MDTGVGRQNGAIAAKVAKDLAPGNRLFLTTTHFHPEHSGGVLGFPADTILIRNRTQQDEMDQHGEEMIRLFAGRKEFWKSLLAGEQLRAPDVIFDRELRLNLGGNVKARLLWFGAAHTSQWQPLHPSRRLHAFRCLCAKDHYKKVRADISTQEAGKHGRGNKVVDFGGPRPKRR